MMVREEKLLTLFTTAVFLYKLLHVKLNEGKEEFPSSQVVVCQSQAPITRNTRFLCQDLGMVNDREYQPMSALSTIPSGCSSHQQALPNTISDIVISKTYDPQIKFPVKIELMVL